MKHTTQRWMAVAALAMTAVCRPARGQAAYAGLVQVAPNIYQPTFAPAAGASAPRTQMGRISASFSLAQTDEAVNGGVTRARYTATGVALSLVPADGVGAGRRLVGNVEVVTETTTDASGTGHISGVLTFTGRSSNGIVAQLVTLQLDGTYGDGAAPLQAQGQLNVPSTNSYERALWGDVSATLSSNASLSVQLSGLAAVAGWVTHRGGLWGGLPERFSGKPPHWAASGT